MNVFRLLLAVLSCGLTVACAWPGKLLRGYAEGRPIGLDSAVSSIQEAGGDPKALGVAHFFYDDWGSLNTDGLDRHTVPWKVAATAMVLEAHDERGLPLELATLAHVLTEVGFIQPDAILNWAGPPPDLDRPIGLVRGTMSRGFPSVQLEGANVGCAACHTGRLYDETGRATRSAWIGLPNTSLDLEAYVTMLFRGLAHFQGQEERFWEAMDTLFGDMSIRERNTIRNHALPLLRDRFAEDWQGRTSLLPFINGSAGLTNGVGAIKNLLGMLGEDETTTEVAFTSIPDLGGTILRSSLLYDGTYGLPDRPRFAAMELAQVTSAHLDGLADITTFFVVPTLGVQPGRARDGYSGVRYFMDFLETLRAPPFPGPIDSALAMDGRRIYHQECARCHGEFSDGLEEVLLVSFPNRLVPQDSMGSDPRRWELATAEFADEVHDTPYGRYLHLTTTGGYVAQPLTALWATAPYLHNGSVPTLWHMMHPEARPERFMVGGHMLDFELVGIAGELDDTGVYRYPADYTPWSTPALYDAGSPGMGRSGHEAEFRALTEEQKTALLEYLKVL